MTCVRVKSPQEQGAQLGSGESAAATEYGDSTTLIVAHCIERVSGRARRWQLHPSQRRAQPPSRADRRICYIAFE